MSKKKPQPQELTDMQKQLREWYTPHQQAGLSEQAKRLFDAAVKKITFTPTEAGGLSVDYGGLTPDEVYALGIAGTDAWPLFTPKQVCDQMRDALPQGKIIPTSEQLEIQMRLRETGRKSALIVEQGNNYLERQRKSAGRLRDNARKYTDKDHSSWEKQARELKTKNTALSVRAIADKLSAVLKVPEPTIRAYLLKKKVLDS
jgi:hypothetical protein